MSLFPRFYIQVKREPSVKWKEEHKIQAAEMKFLRSAQGYSPLDWKMNGESRRALNVVALLNKIGENRMRRRRGGDVNT